MPKTTNGQPSWGSFFLSSVCFLGLIGTPLLNKPSVAIQHGAHRQSGSRTVVSEKGRQRESFNADRLGMLQASAIASTQAIVQLKGLPVSLPKTQGTAIVPLKAHKTPRLLIIEGRVQQQPESFLVDTGASTTLLSKSLINRLQLQGQPISGDRLTSAVAGDDCPTMDANLHRLPSMTIGALKVQDLRGLEFLNIQIPHGLSGVLGMNLLSAFDLKISPKTRQLSLMPPSSLPSEMTAKAIPLQRRLGVMLAQLNVNQQGPFTFMLDTGAAGTFISPHVAQAAQSTHFPRQSVKVQGFCGLEPAYRVTMPQVQFGEHRVQNVETVVLDSSAIKTLQVDGILGQNVLDRFDQYWRFPTPTLPDSQAQGSLLLSPLPIETP